jgi:hypothetical protein
MSFFPQLPARQLLVYVELKDTGPTQSPNVGQTPTAGEPKEAVRNEPTVFHGYLGIELPRLCKSKNEIKSTLRKEPPSPSEARMTQTVARERAA